MPSVSRKQQIAMAISPQYIAGFLDGEGHVTILKRNQYTRYPSYGLHVGFTNRDLRVLNAIKSVYGGNLFQKKRYKAAHSSAFELRIGKRSDVERLLSDVLPYLIIKREQAEIGLAFLQLRRVKMEVTLKRGKSWPLFKGNESDIEARAQMKQQLSVLNARGVM